MERLMAGAELLRSGLHPTNRARADSPIAGAIEFGAPRRRS
jgi:hypothetical protein